MYFLGINPKDTLPDKNLLSKFRNNRLLETTLDEIIIEIIRRGIEKEIIKCNSISVDTTHIEVNTIYQEIFYEPIRKKQMKNYKIYLTYLTIKKLKGCVF